MSKDYSSGPDFKPDSAAKAAMALRKAAGPRILAEVPAGTGTITARPKRLSWPAINNRDYSRLELADMAAEAKRLERAAKRAEAARQFRAEAVRHSAEVVAAELTPVQLAELAKAKRAARVLAEARAMAEAAKGIGVTAAELAEAIRIERELFNGSLRVDYAPRPVVETGQRSELTRGQRAEVANWTREALASEAAEAGREALAAIGPAASAVVITKRGGQSVTLAKVTKVPDVALAAKRAEAAEARLTVARVKLAEAETKVAAAKAAKAVRPIREADREADRIAASVAKLARRAEAADKALAAAASVASMPAADGLVFVPLASYRLAEAAKAAELEIPARPDRMPARYADSGPSVSWARSVSGRGFIGPASGGQSDPTGDSAAALADGYRMELARAEAAAAKLAAKTTRENCEAAAKAAREAKRTADNAKRAAAARQRRRAAKQAAR